MMHVPVNVGCMLLQMSEVGMAWQLSIMMALLHHQSIRNQPWPQVQKALSRVKSWSRLCKRWTTRTLKSKSWCRHWKNWRFTLCWYFTIDFKWIETQMIQTCFFSSEQLTPAPLRRQTLCSCLSRHDAATAALTKTKIKLSVMKRAATIII